jgi:hypothetical protein
MSTLALVGLEPEHTSAPKSMSLDTVGPSGRNPGVRARLARPPPRRDRTLETRDVAGASRATRAPPLVREAPAETLVTGARPRRLIPEHPRAEVFANRVDDIEGARPRAPAWERRTRVTDAMLPAYTPLEGWAAAEAEAQFEWRGPRIVGCASFVLGGYGWCCRCLAPPLFLFSVAWGVSL